jgi:hypothetical protein
MQPGQLDCTQQHNISHAMQGAAANAAEETTGSALQVFQEY